MSRLKQLASYSAAAKAAVKILEDTLPAEPKQPAPPPPQQQGIENGNGGVAAAAAEESTGAAVA
eukprot:216104-Alexandrium_andersonii.AAC.1